MGMLGSVSTDLSGRDVDISWRMCEHLLHLQQLHEEYKALYRAVIDDA